MIYFLYWFASGLFMHIVKLFLFFRGPSNYLEWTCELQDDAIKEKAKKILSVNNRLNRIIFHSISLFQSVLYGPLILLDIYLTNKVINDIINKRKS